MNNYFSKNFRFSKRLVDNALSYYGQEPLRMGFAANYATKLCEEMGFLPSMQSELSWIRSLAQTVYSLEMAASGTLEIEPSLQGTLGMIEAFTSSSPSDSGMIKFEPNPRGMKVLKEYQKYKKTYAQDSSILKRERVMLNYIPRFQKN